LGSYVYLFFENFIAINPPNQAIGMKAIVISKTLNQIGLGNR
jgi:hypothetical protein